ncbi:hypothetical protein GLOTRDRAFT_107927 [Gloeophyllum trabeum ATCC 11539]|uniref:Xylanolytic transcriptional activator regulatory domain-containing protein n=1 Tax=Gloeophyllum trabeum (strain ATCC 11539 / FP-39264 / Madison 617) TaxID=670483 RepID=S7RC24_GLOTA|nr:uncharacterized protein GLOTRDRAFT_107927 [Gloeophyllum trabeum ATCC 11539]EPQ51790.1 hypothetical protein GLOTRDRAFT_107927 [Gloeophyllum trabeum ATCC 11539]
MHRLHPSFNWFHFKRRVRALFDTNISTGIDRAAAHEILFGKGPGSPARKAEAPRHTLSFFAAVAAALELGALAWKEEGYEGLEAMREDGDAEPQVGKDGKRPRKAKAGKASSGPASEGGREALQHPDPAALYALSRQALDIFEMFHPHDLDFLVAMDMQVLFLLHDGIPNISSVVFPMVGKMVNVARAMGLAMDPDEFPSRYSLFEAETRRRIWWDVFYYDLFVSDCMGHPPLIADNSHTTKIPVSDVDEERFVPESIEIPTCKEEDSSESAVNSSTYLVLKCR